MDSAALLRRLRDHTSEVPPAILEDFVRRMDPDYFAQFSIREITAHLQLLRDLSPERPFVLRIAKQAPGHFHFTLVAYDYFSEFATVCGLLAAYGLDIREALIFTYADADQGPPEKGGGASTPPSGAIRHFTSHSPRPMGRRPTVPGLSRKKVVDVFQVRVLPGFSFGKREQAALHAELQDMFRLLDSQQIRQVRAHVNRHLIEALGKLRKEKKDFMHPAHITFHNDPAERDTVMEIRALDTPAFLYTFANALTMRGIYVAKALIEVKGNKVQNRLYVRGRHGHKIERRSEQEELTATAALIKEFTHFLSWAPDPAKALERFDQLLDQLLEDDYPSQDLSLLKQKPLLAHLAQLFGTSDYLWEDCLRRQHANLLPLMEGFLHGPLGRGKAELRKRLRAHIGRTKDPESRKTRLNQFKDQELFRIDMKHLLENSSLPEFSQALTALAEVILDQALDEARTVVNRRWSPPRLANGKPVPLTICGLGKLGGGELGYASDIEVLFVYGSQDGSNPKSRTDAGEYFERVAQELLRWIEAKREGIFHLDTRLRPHGDKGLLANSLQEIQAYYSPTGGAAPFERQALIKLRHVAGDLRLGSLVERHRDGFVYSEEPWSLETALHIRGRQIKELVPPGKIHVKYGPGGLIDSEYTVQYLQLLHGHRLPTLRTPKTLEAMDAVKQAGLLAGDRLETLRADYLFLRQLIDALRIVRGHAQDLVLPPSGSEEMIYLARRLGFVTEEWQEGAALLEKEIHERMTRTHALFVEKFGAPG